VLLSTDVAKEIPGDASSRQHQIVCDVTAFGSDGPLSGSDHSDIEIQALTGIIETTGMPDGSPIPIPIPMIEYLAGINAAGAILAALRVRRQSGVGQHIDIALYDCAFAATSSFLARLVGGAKDVQRIGNRHALSSPWNVYKAADGWVQICTGSDDQWRRLCEVMSNPDLAGQTSLARSADRVAHNSEVDRHVAHWVSTCTVSGCVDRLAAASIAGGAVAPIDDYPQEPNLDYREMIRRIAVEGGEQLFAPASPLRMSRTPGRSPSRVSGLDEDRSAIEEILKHRGTQPADQAATDRVATPLAGIRILEIGHYTTAPAAARYFAALGADVIKIEPPEGEAARAWPPVDRGQSIFYTVTNSDKRSIVLDLGNEEDCAHLRSLIEQADVLIENLKPGALARRGFSYETMTDLNPGLVYCAISGFGAHSLYPGRPAFDTVVQGTSGLMTFVRSENGVPLKTGISSADILGAAMAVVAVLAALEVRERSGLGQYIDLSMQDVMAWVTQVVWNKRNFAPHARVHQCTDGFVLQVDSESEGAFGHSDHLSAMSRDAAVSALRNSGKRAVPLLRSDEAVDAGQTKARKLIFEIEDDRGTWPALAIPMRLSRTSPRVRRPSPPLGRDTEIVLAGSRPRPNHTDPAAFSSSVAQTCF
jgi:crotonobetainyl-CoA:carnitine CoA-transferase CaiB-like acyl-CoA transferase